MRRIAFCAFLLVMGGLTIDNAFFHVTDPYTQPIRDEIGDFFEVREMAVDARSTASSFKEETLGGGMQRRVEESKKSKTNYTHANFGSSSE